MTGRRRVPLVLRVCTGVLLLLFSTVAVDATKDPPSSSEKLLAPDVSETSIFEQNKTILNKIPSRDESEFLIAETKNEAVGPYNSTKGGFETVDDELVKDAKTVGKEKVPMSIDEDTELQGIGSRDQVDRLSTVDSANSGSKLEEIVYGTSGKSSSTKTISEDAYRLSRTNGLTAVTAKPALEESKVDETKNKTGLVERSNDTSRQEPRETKKSSEDGLELKEERVTDTKEEAASSSKEASTDSGVKSETFNPENESAPEKVRFLGEFQQRKKKAEGPVKNSEVPDLKEADERKEEDVSVSLINDTYVNYSHRPKISTEKSVETDSADKWTPLENATNFITEEIPVTHESRHPKEEVEVVGNVTQSVIQRFIDRQSQNSTSKDAGLANELNRTSNRDEDFLRDSANANETSHEKQQEIEEKNEEKLARLTTERTGEGISSPIPKGRTIAFESASSKRTIVAKKNATDRFADQKPYPYTKSPKESLRNASNQLDVTTEEASALENTIGKGQSEEKFVVTEGSDVLENSIQQFNPTYYEKVSNESSTISSTEVRPSVQITTAPLVRLEETRPTNQTVVEKSSEQKGIDESGEKSTSAGNDVSRWAESRETSGMGNVDVTGNGITEVSVKPESGDKRTYEASLQEITVRTTPTPLTTEPVEPQTDLGMLSNADAQTNVAGSLLIRSTLNATELSTEYPLIKGNFSDERLPIIPTSPTGTSTAKVATDSTTVLPTTTIEETSVGNVTEPPTVSDVNGTNEIPSGVSGTLSPGETFVPTTISVEFEFVGLSDSTTFLWRNVTEEPPKGRDLPNETSAVPTVKDLLAKSTPNEGTTTTSNESTTENISSISETEIPTTSNPMTDRTIVPTSIPSQTVQSKDEFTTRPSFVDEETDSSSTSLDEVEKTIDVTDSWSTTSEENVATTTIRTEQTISKDSKDSYFMANVTESPVEFTSIPNVYTTDATRVATSSPFVPIGLEPRTPVSSSTSPATVSDIPSVTAHDATVLPDQEEITSLVRIDVEGTWFDVCPQMDKLRHTLANILTSGMNKPVSDKQIIFHQNPCQEPPNTTPSSSDMPMMTILIYVVDEAGKFDSTMTKMLPSLYENSRDRVKFPITIHRFLLVQEKGPDSGNAIAVVVVSSVALICLVLLTGLLFIMRKRQTRFNYGERCRPVSLDAYSLDSVSAYNSVRRKGVTRSSKRSYGNPTFEDSSAIPSHPLNFAALSSFCNDVNAINEEFSGIPQVSAKIDELPAGAEVKNRYANVIPLPETRVLLQKINNDPLTEYINASYVRGPKNATKYYVACQAPMESTVTDFWRMIWEQQCKVIIMLTDLVENGVEKCTEYIPPSEVTDCRRLYGDFQVTLKKRETKEKYAISTLHLNNLEKNTFREVYHIWYLWPVNGVQSDGAGLIAVLLEARALQRGGPGPIVVHCSPGTGRTGTLIALDLGIRQYEITRTVDVPRVVYTIRRDRAGAVKTKEQYAFIYKALNLYATKLAGGVLEST